MTYGSELHNYLGKGVPQEYGGNGPPLSEAGITPKYSNTDENKQQLRASSIPAAEKNIDDSTTTKPPGLSTETNVVTPAIAPTSAADARAPLDPSPEVSGKPAEKADVA